MGGSSCLSIVWNATSKPITLLFETWSLKPGPLKSGTCLSHRATQIREQQYFECSKSNTSPHWPLQNPVLLLFSSQHCSSFGDFCAPQKVVEMSLPTIGMFARIKMFFYTGSSSRAKKTICYIYTIVSWVSLGCPSGNNDTAVLGSQRKVSQKGEDWLKGIWNGSRQLIIIQILKS